MTEEKPRISVTLTQTINLGAYENVKIEVGESIPAEPNAEDPLCTEQIRDLADALVVVLKEKGKEYSKFLKPKKEN